ncbi:MAG: flagellar M-ring protein FliF, partial [Treponema sp.]|nr:flagellar M-ring protein FliF [Treponema sp.]
MNEWFKKRTQTVKDKWGKWTPLQKGILIGIIILIVIAIVMMMKFSARPATVRLFNSPVNDEVLRSQIVTRLDNDNVRSYVSQDGYISVDDEKTAKRYRSILVSEGLEPAAKDPYSLFNTQRWSQSDFQNKVEWQEAQERLLEGHLKQLDFVSRANVRLVLPDDKLFTEEQAPTTASVVLFAKSGAELRPHVKGIQHLIARSVEGLKDDCEYITIIDGATGEEINDTKGQEEYNRMSFIEKAQKIISKRESEYTASVLKSLQSIYTDDRVRVANMKVEMDMSEKKSEKKEDGGITLKPDNVNTPYDDSLIVEKIAISEETVDKEFTGTGYNPEGPAGVEGQNPPVYSDNDNMIGKSTEKGTKRNYVVNETHSTENVLPNTPERITVSVNIDGKWNYPLYDEQGKVRIT